MVRDLVGLHAGEGREEVRCTVGAEDGDRPGEAGGAGSEGFEAGDEAAAAGAGAEVAEERGGAGDGFEHPVAGLGEEFDRLVRVARGHRPQFAAERLVRVAPERVAGESGGGSGGEGVQAEGQDGAFGERREARRRLRPVGPLRRRAVGEDDEDREPPVPSAPGEGVQPGQGLGVGPVGVVHEQHQRLVPQPVREAAEEPCQAVPHTLRVGGRRRGRERRCDPERGGQEVVVVAEEAADVLGPEPVEGGLEQLPGEVEGDRGEGLAAPGGQHRAAVPRGAVDRREQGRLSYARLAPEDEYPAAPRAGRRRAGDERVDGVRRRGELRVAFEQSGRLRPAGSGPYRTRSRGVGERLRGRRLFGFRRHRALTPPHGHPA